MTCTQHLYKTLKPVLLYDYPPKHNNETQLFNLAFPQKRNVSSRTFEMSGQLYDDYLNINNPYIFMLTFVLVNCVKYVWNRYALRRIVTCGIASLAILLLTIDVRYYGSRQTGLERPQLGNVPNVKRPNARSPRKNAGVERVSQYMTTIPFRTRALMVFAAVSQNALMETSRLAKSHAIQDHASMNAEGVPMIVYPTPRI